MTLGSRSLGMVIRMLYPLSYATWQDTVFHVNGIGPLPGITTDMAKSKKLNRDLDRNPQLLRKAYEKIRGDLEELDQLIEEWEEDEDGNPVTELNVAVPQKVDLRLDSSLDVVYCSGCRKLSRLSKIGRNTKSGLPFHKGCEYGGRFKQAPFFVPRPSDSRVVGVTGEPGAIKPKSLSSRQIMCRYLGAGATCNHPDSKDGRCDTRSEFQLSYLLINPKRPISGLRIINDHCPKGLGNIPWQKLTPPRVGAGHYYAKRFPSPGISSPLFVSIADEDKKTSKDIDYVNSYINEVKKTLFNSKYVNIENTRFSKINVLEIVYGMRLGGAKSGSYTEHWLKGGENNNVIGRMLSTRGFVVSIKPEIYEKLDSIVEKYPDLKEKENPKRYALDIIAHTLKHAMLVLVPRFTGYEDQKFMGAYEVLEGEGGAKVYLYDNENGGHGGFATLIKSGDSFKKMVSEIARTRLNCPVRECKYACGNCLFIRRCGKVNRDLNRHMLLDAEIFQPQLALEKN